MYLEKLIKLRDENKNICLLGYGKEIQQFHVWLNEVVGYKNENIVIADKNKVEIKDVKIFSGDNYLDVLDEDYGMVFKAPGLWSLNPSLVNYRERNGADSIHSSLVFFLEKYRNNMIMITGTKGKTTTSNWCKHFLTNSDVNKKIEYCGNTTNISPYQFWTELENTNDKYYFVIEVSSFQLQDLGTSNISPKNSIITNLYIDHLDQHNNKVEYWNAKDNIFKYQFTSDSLTITEQVLGNIIERKVDLKSKFEIVKLADIEEFKSKYKLSLLGDHNWSNMILALKAIQKIANVSNNNVTLQQIMDTFEPPKGRLELIKTVQISGVSVTFYNDNTATEPDAVVAALKALATQKDSKTILFISGKWKNGNHAKLSEEIKIQFESKCLSRVYYFGEVGQKLYSLINGKDQDFISFKNFLADETEFIDDLKSTSSSKEININVLFSPSGSSFDEFTNYIERGDKYLDWINRIDNSVK